MEQKTGAQCSVCHRPGAKWIARLGNERLAVHSSCGKTLVAMAPKGQAVKVIPSEDLRTEWQAKAFWTAKFAAAAKKA
jgi:DNA-binding IclR family transcriptional regulator